MPVDRSAMNAARRYGNVSGFSLVATPGGGPVESFVVGITDDDAVAGFAEKRDVVLLAEIDDVLVAAGPDEHRHAVVADARNEVDGALNGVEVAAAVGGHDQARRRAVRRDCPRAKRPGRGGGDAAEPVRDDGVGVHLDGVGMAVGEHARVQIDGGRRRADDHRVEVESFREAADCGSLRRGRHAGIEGVDERVRGRIVDADLPGRSGTRRRAEVEHEMRVRIEPVGTLRRKPDRLDRLAGGRDTREPQRGRQGQSPPAERFRRKPADSILHDAAVTTIYCLLPRNVESGGDYGDRRR